MSKQDLIDELSENAFDGVDGRVVGFHDLIDIINEHLEGKVIVPEVPTIDRR